jgi:alkanesulfonate monooxygenase SsuD/methylene tetrahydromethanopterin reductase-like flavin-dependent oxidoreductase (luciferase family)
MRFGFVVPWADAADTGELAVAAERHGWDGLFVWEPVWGVDAWVSLAVAATRTSTLRLGTMITPLPRRKPWELAGQVATVDRLSHGRVVLSVGLGAPDAGYADFGEITDRRLRAELLDEGLAVVRGLWAGQPFEFTGKHYTIRPSDFPALGHTVQQPGVPVWCVGALGAPRSIRRALTCNGLIPQAMENGAARHATLHELADFVATTELPSNYDIIVEGQAVEHAPAAWAEAGATWWLESMWSAMSDPDPVDAALSRLVEGPPTLH